ncbi:MAG TPA: hypothetical protein VE243_05035, partial [Candidatus Acidoferrum sp.]|nr:hypothetical protein [Candidatus Acidoferrum sp.]
PFEIQSLPTYYLPDLLNAALLSIFLLAVASQTDLVAGILLLLLFLSRESTILIAATVIPIAIMAHRRTLGVAAIAATVAGVAITHYFAALGPANVHGLPDFYYLTFKVGYNALHNLAGIKLSVPSGRMKPCRPEWILTLPSVLRTSYLSQLGICQWNPYQPVATIGAWLTGFGAAPAITIWCALKVRNEILRAPTWTLIAAVYGVLAFAIGPLTGTGVDRLIGYGWPLFLVAMPYFFGRVCNWERATMATLLGCHAALFAINFATPPLFARLSADHRAPVGALLDAAALALQIGAYRTLARTTSETTRAALATQT